MQIEIGEIMKTYKISAILVAVTLVLAPHVSHAKQKEEIITQRDMEKDACGGFEKADAELNRVYKKILTKYRSDKAFLEKLKKAQKAWLAYRDAHIESVYPAGDKQVEYGSVYGMCLCGVKQELTAQRTKTLRQWSEGVMEGDVCSGSRKWKSEE